jgi:hypothetical protein
VCASRLQTWIWRGLSETFDLFVAARADVEVQRPTSAQQRPGILTS